MHQQFIYYRRLFYNLNQVRPPALLPSLVLMKFLYETHFVHGNSNRGHSYKPKDCKNRIFYKIKACQGRAELLHDVLAVPVKTRAVTFQFTATKGRC